METHGFDPEMAMLADRHYTRQSPGARQFAGNGEKIVLRNAEGSVLFVWLLERFRWDGLRGYNNQWFRNESSRSASEIILEAERFAIDRWGPGLAFTFIDAHGLGTRKHRSAEFCPWPIGRCYLRAGWRETGISAKRSKLIFEKGLA